MTAGLISATGNVAGNYFIGNGSQLTGIDATSIQNGTSNVRVLTSGGNVSVGIGGTSNVAVFYTAGIIANSIAATNNGAGQNFKIGDDAWIGDINLSDTMSVRGQQNAANGYIVFGNADSTALGRTGSGPLTYGGAFSVTGNITGAAITGTSLTVGTGTITGGNIVNANGNGVGNIGSSSLYFNTVFAKATSAQYADLAEKYLADQPYEIGTVLAAGGNAEVTACQIGDRAIGAVSENPAYKMNDGLENGTYVALKGRVPVKVIGAVRKGQRLVAANDGCAVAGVPHANDVFAVSLESSDNVSVKLIESVIL